MSQQQTRQESHPEQHTGEVFLGYCNRTEFNSLEWKSKREGQLVFADDGGIVGQAGVFLERRLFPVFMSRAEREANRREESLPFYQHA